MLRKTIVFMFVLVIFISSPKIYSAWTMEYAPYAKVKNEYSANVSCGTIRYVSQIDGSSYFYSAYWPSSSFGGYGSPKNECGTASVSMALSYVGINKMPKTILETNHGYTYFSGWGAETSSPTVAEGMSNYISGNGKYSPVIIHLPKYSASGHWVVLIGRVSSKVYQVLDPARTELWNITVNGNSATYSKDGHTVNDTIDRTYQYYNPKANIDAPMEHLHQYNSFVTEATCTEQGYTRYICSECDDSYTSNYTQALGHAWNSGAVTLQPTATQNGLKTYTCTRCWETKTEEIPATGVQTPCNGGSSCPSGKFKDVNASHWFHESVDFAVSQGLFGGMSDTTFAPNTAMTRAMLVTVLWRYAGQPAEGVNNFTDVANNQWYTNAVAWAANSGVVTGVGNNKFNPNGKITREQMAAILYRYANGSGIDTSARADLSSFPDRSKVSSYASDAIRWAVAEGLINGADGKLMPQGNATRAQVATILMRFINNMKS